MREVPLDLKREWVEQSCRLRRHSCFEPVDMDWFRALHFIRTTHYRKRQKERDAAKALYRIQSAQGRGLHPLFGPPLIATCLDQEDAGKVIIVAHDLCLICAPSMDGFVIITTLPMEFRGPHHKFTDFVKSHCPHAIVRKRRPSLKQCRKALDNIDVHNERIVSKRAPINSKINVVNAAEKVRSNPSKPRRHKWRPLCYSDNVSIKVVISGRK